MITVRNKEEEPEINKEEDEGDVEETALDEEGREIIEDVDAEAGNEDEGRGGLREADREANGDDL